MLPFVDGMVLFMAFKEKRKKTIEKEREELSAQLLTETAQHPVPSMKDIRFFLNQFRNGDINDPKYRQGLVDMLVNKLYL